MIEHPTDAFLNDHGIKPGLQFTATTPELMQVALKMTEMQDGDQYGSKNVSSCLGGCCVNTSRASQMYLNSCPDGPFTQKVLTLGCIGQDDSGSFVQQKLKEDSILHSLHIDPNAHTGCCPTITCQKERTCVAILDACEKYPHDHL